MKCIVPTVTQPWILLAAVSFAAALSWSQPCSAFEADGLYSGMSLEDFKKSSFLAGKRIDLFNDTPKNTLYIINGRDRVDFCYGFLSLYRKNISDPLILSSLIQTARRSRLIDEIDNEKFGSVNDGKTYYETMLTWILDSSKYKLWFRSLRPVHLSDMRDERAVSAAVSFRPYPPGESMSLSQECTRTRAD